MTTIPAALNAPDDRAPAIRGKTGEARARDYVDLLKPRVMSLVVFTALTGYVAAPGGGDLVMGFAAILAIAVGAGAAGALNMWWDADIDALMRRTKTRPIPGGRVARDEAGAFGGVLAVLSVITMWLCGGWLAASLLAFTIFFYLVVYSVWLKRRTAQNIVIGGLAGALPPAIGWAAATGGSAPAPWIMVALIFFWTPPHFWALALYKAGDYEKAGVPMLPVTAGDRATRRQIFAYVLLLGPLTAAPLFTETAGALYAAVGALAYVGLFGLSVRVLKGGPKGGEDGAGDLYVAKDKAARDLFAYSILYLFALFAALFVEGLA